MWGIGFSVRGVLAQAARQSVHLGRTPWLWLAFLLGVLLVFLVVRSKFLVRKRAGLR